MHARDFLLAAILVGATVPAWGQAIEQTSSGAQGAASIPDFSGIWAHLTWPDFEPPPAGPGPVTNRSRRDGVSDVFELVGDYTNPILKPQAAEIVKRHGEISLTRVPYPTPSNQCWPGGVPFVLFNIGMQMLQQPDKITILYSNDHEVRHVRMNQPHPANVTPSWYGDSVGHYEGGDTLVVDTIGQTTKTFVDPYLTPHTEQLHVIERYKLTDGGKAIDISIHVEDPGAFTTPWNAKQRFQRIDREWEEDICAENNADFLHYEVVPLPHADRPDF
jgi:hypothetical protein